LYCSKLSLNILAAHLELEGIYITLASGTWVMLSWKLMFQAVNYYFIIITYINNNFKHIAKREMYQQTTWYNVDTTTIKHLAGFKPTTFQSWVDYRHHMPTAFAFSILTLSFKTLKKLWVITMLYPSKEFYLSLIKKIVRYVVDQSIDL